jgi:hypothetical protein
VVCGLVWLQERTLKRHVFKRDSSTYSTHDYLYRLDSEYIWGVGWGDLHDHLMSTSVFNEVMNIIFIQTSIITRKVAMTLGWICLPSCSTRVFHILREVG